MKRHVAAWAGAVLLLVSGFVLATKTTGASSASGASGEAAGHGPDAKTNRLAAESSPYLQLHRFNPVDWYPWGDEALGRARREQKPIFLSVGYSTCYWCHVMERESFSDPEIAAFMNEHFINIKVDREERPDLDEIYMLATQLLARGRGGWPNSVFLTPQLEPFFAGTYFPPDDRGGRPGFTTLLRALERAWREDRPQIQAQATRAAERLRSVLEGRASPAGMGAEVGDAVGSALASLEQRFDPSNGGFSRAPKFPSPSNLFLLLEQPDHARAQQMLDVTLNHMARGGVYDQVGGGFHRYATDAAWRVPHFEKMLYDNGSLLEVYALHHERRRDATSRRVLEQIAEFLGREMTSSGGAFFSAIDAETDAREGAFYIWRPDELRVALSSEEHAFAAPVLGFEGEPTFRDPHAPGEPPTFILHLPRPAPAADEQRLDAVRTKLLEVRSARKRPLTDEKILTDWNGLAIAGLAEAGRVLNDPAMLEQARRAASFLLENATAKEQPLQHMWHQGEARIDAFLADYAYFIHGLLALHRATDERRWLKAARDLHTEQVERLGDPEHGGFFVAALDPDLLSRSKDASDGARPSPNGMALLNLDALYRLTGATSYRDLALGAASAFSAQLAQSPAGHTTLARATARLARPLSLEDEARSKLTARATWANRGAGGKDVVVTLDIAPGWHVNANPASDEFLVPTRLSAPPSPLDVTYPAGEWLDTAFADERVRVYAGRLVLTAGPVPEAAPLRLEAQVCDASRCLPAVTLTLPIEKKP